MKLPQKTLPFTVKIVSLEPKQKGTVQILRGKQVTFLEVKKLTKEQLLLLAAVNQDQSQQLSVIQDQ